MNRAQSRHSMLGFFSCGIDVVGCIEAALPPDLLRSRKIVSVCECERETALQTVLSSSLTPDSLSVGATRIGGQSTRASEETKEEESGKYVKVVCSTTANGQHSFFYRGHGQRRRHLRCSPCGNYQKMVTSMRQSDNLVTTFQVSCMAVLVLLISYRFTVIQTERGLRDIKQQLQVLGLVPTRQPSSGRRRHRTHPDTQASLSQLDSDREEREWDPLTEGNFLDASPRSASIKRSSREVVRPRPVGKGTGE